MARGTRRRASWRRSSMLLRTFMSSNYATTQALLAWPLFAAMRAISALAVCRDRIDGGRFAHSSLRENRRHVRGEAALQRLRGHQRIVADPVPMQRRPVDDQCLRVRTLQL